MSERSRRLGGRDVGGVETEQGERSREGDRENDCESIRVFWILKYR